MRSFLSLVGTYTVSPEVSMPEYTRKNVRLPTKGSFRILKAKRRERLVVAGLASRRLTAGSCPSRPAFQEATA